MHTKQLIDSVIKQVQLPAINGERCVHALVENASCEACVEACPRHAWVLNDELLGLDTGTCDGCGLCVPACPEAAIQHDYQPEPRSFKGRGVALVACEKTGLTGSGVVPCLHAIGTTALLPLYQNGMRTLLFSHGDCDNCQRGSTSQSLPRFVKQLRRMLNEHQLPAINARAYCIAEWEERREYLHQGAVGSRVSRRNFLRNALGTGIEQGIQATALQPVEDDKPATAAEFLHQSVNSGLLPYVPIIDEQRCIGCDVCVRLCPHSAILLQTDPLSYRIQARDCSGCGLCIDNCEHSAIHVAKWANSQGQQLLLQATQCRSCGIPFHHPKQHSDAIEECRICVQAQHHTHLFQVLK